MSKYNTFTKAVKTENSSHLLIVFVTCWKYFLGHV